MKEISNQATLEKILNLLEPVATEDHQLLLDQLAHAAEKLGNEIENSRN